METRLKVIIFIGFNFFPSRAPTSQTAFVTAATVSRHVAIFIHDNVQKTRVHDQQIAISLQVALNLTFDW